MKAHLDTNAGRKIPDQRERFVIYARHCEKALGAMACAEDAGDIGEARTQRAMAAYWSGRAFGEARQ
jgi:hypothetical protein